MSQDYGKAAQWYRLAAQQGLAQAQHNLGVLYDNGSGVAQDYGEAVRWYFLAADQGLAQAQYNLGAMLYNGDGVPQDSIKAYLWVTLAAWQGIEDAATKQNYLEESFTPGQLAEAQRLAREWKPKGE